VEHEAAETNEQITVVGDLEDSIVGVSTAGFYPLPGAVPEHQVGEGVHDLGGVVGSIVVLQNVSVAIGRGLRLCLPLHTTAGWK